MTTPPSRTLILIKPDAVRRGLTGEVLRRFEAKGYQVVALRMVQATTQMLAEHYHEHVSKPFYPGVERYMSSGPLVALVLQGQRVIEGARSVMGATDPTMAAPGTIRGDLGRDWGGEAIENLVHGSDSPDSAARETVIWFPELAS